MGTCIERALVRLQFLCFDCDVDTYRAGENYAVTDAVWEAALLPGEKLVGCLCIKCLERRIGRRLTPADFTAAPINAPGWDRKPTGLRARLAGREPEQPR
jgi:hypothetical protein